MTEQAIGNETGSSTPAKEQAAARPPVTIFEWLRAWFFYNPLIYTYTVVLGTLSLLSSLFDRGGRVQHGFARLWSRLILGTIGAGIRVVGLEKIDTSQPKLYLCNHLSALDIPVLYVSLPFQFRIMAKRELFRYPFMGWHLKRSGQISVDASSARAVVHSLNCAMDSVKKGMPVVIFPEGGRSETGRVAPFQGGAFYSAIKAKAEIVPIALVGTYEMLPMNKFVIRPRRVELVLGEPISTAGMNARQMDELAARVQKVVEEMYYARWEGR